MGLSATFICSVAAILMRDMNYLKQELPVDMACFFMMPPLPGSKGHLWNRFSLVISRN